MNSLIPKERNALQLIISKPELQSYFFNKATDIKWLMPFVEAGLFNPKTVPKPEPADEKGYFKIRQWEPISYLNNVKGHFSDNSDIAKQILEIIKNVTSYAKENKFSNYHVWWRFAEFLACLPLDIISEEDITELVSYWLSDPYGGDLVLNELNKGFLKIILENSSDHSKTLAIKLVKEIFTVEPDETQMPEKKQAIFKVKDRRNYHLEELTKAHAKSLGETLGIEGCIFFKEQLTLANSISDNNNWSSLWQPAIEEHEQNKHRHKCENMLVNCLRDSLCGCIEQKISQNVLDFVKECLIDESNIIQRIAIYIINQYYEKLDSLSETVLSIGNLFNPNNIHEYWHFLNKHFSSLTNAQKKQVLEAIEGIKANKENETNDKHILYRKVRWYSAIKQSEEGARKIQEYNKLGILASDHPDFGSYFSGVMRMEIKSPYTSEELLKLDIPELINKIDSYDGPIESFAGDKPDLRGLCSTLRETVKLKPEKFVDSFDNWLKLPPYFIQELLSAYTALWKDKVEDLPWDTIWINILRFCDKLINQEIFWSYSCEDKNDHWKTKSNYVPGNIAEFIESGVRDDKHAFNPEYLPLAKNIIVKMLDKVECGNYEKESLDALTIAINSPRGKCLKALINLALRSCRLADKNNNSHAEEWEKEYKLLFEKEFRFVDSGLAYDFVPLATECLYNFMYLSKQWTLDKLSWFFPSPKDDKLRWLAAMQGYSYSSNISLDVYRFLKDSGYLIKALDEELLKESVRERIIDEAVIIYLWGDETLEDDNGIVKQIFERKKTQELHQLLWYIWTQRSKEEEQDEKFIPKIFELWKHAIKKMEFSQDKEIQDNEYKQLASELCKWVVFIEDLDDSSMNLLMPICRYAEKSWNSDQIIKALARLVDKYPNQAFDIYFEMLTGAIAFRPKEEIAKVLSGIKLRADKGNDKVNDIYKVYIENGEADLVNEIRGLMEHGE